jgi:rhodanese-related sulfurtransferase
MIAVPEISVSELARERARGAITVVDVREKWEREICAIEGSLHLPLHELPSRVDQIPRDGIIAVICHHGMRSAQAVNWLQNNDFRNAVNVTGGIDAWARRVDPNMMVY